MAGETDFNDLSAAIGREEMARRVMEMIDRARGAQAPEKAPLGPEASAGEEGSGRDDWMINLDRTNKGAIKPVTGNVYQILANDDAWRGQLAYCLFSYNIVKRSAVLPGMRAGNWTDSDTSILVVWLNRRYGFDPGDRAVLHALVTAAMENSFHPVREYLESLEWDGVNRLDHWLVDAFDAVPKSGDSSYLAAAGKKFLIGAVARVMRPGCKMDDVLILEGSQGRGKSSAIGVLFGEWFCDAPLPLGDKDAYQNIQGVWGQELAELDSFNKAESTTAKSFFSQRKDRFRPSYGKHVQDFDRQTVFIGTTNQDEYLKDYTGNRRYWPVYCRTVNIDYLTSQRDQLWAEALHRFRAEEPWWVCSGDDGDQREIELFRQEQDARMVLDPWHYLVDSFLRTQIKDFVTADEVLIEAVKRPEGAITRADQNRLAPIMKALGWEKGRGRQLVGGKNVQRRGYCKPEGWGDD